MQPRLSRIWKRHYKRIRINGPLIATWARHITCKKTFPRQKLALQQAVRHDPEGQAHFQLALVYRSLGKKEAANEQFEIARKLKLEGLAHAETQMNTLESVHQ